MNQLFPTEPQHLTSDLVQYLGKYVLGEKYAYDSRDIWK